MWLIQLMLHEGDIFQKSGIFPFKQSLWHIPSMKRQLAGSETRILRIMSTTWPTLSVHPRTTNMMMEMVMMMMFSGLWIFVTVRFRFRQIFRPATLHRCLPPWYKQAYKCILCVWYTHWPLANTVLLWFKKRPKFILPVMHYELSDASKWPQNCFGFWLIRGRSFRAGQLLKLYVGWLGETNMTSTLLWGSSELHPGGVPLGCGWLLVASRWNWTNPASIILSRSFLVQGLWCFELVCKWQLSRNTCQCMVVKACFLLFGT